MRKSLSLLLAATAVSCLISGCSLAPTTAYPIFPAEATTRASQYFDAAYIYQEGLGVPRDYAKAIKFYTLAAKEKKDARALNNLGVMAVRGLGSSPSTSSAMSYFRKAAAGGSAAAHYNIGLLYDAGYGVGRSASNAVAEYRMASEMGYAKAQARLSAMYAQGDGVAADAQEAKRLGDMAQLERYSANVGSQPGNDKSNILANLAVEYCDACATDSEKKMASRHIQDLTSLADSNDAVAQYNLGVKYLKGDGAVLDPSQAARYFTLSARQGYAAAQRQLAQMHLRGQAVAKSKVLAHAWLNLASKEDSSEGIGARVEMENLEVSMSSAEIKEAQEIARSGSLKGR